jgi:hypothetical protein
MENVTAELEGVRMMAYTAPVRASRAGPSSFFHQAAQALPPSRALLSSSCLASRAAVAEYDALVVTGRGRNGFMPLTPVMCLRGSA